MKNDLLDDLDTMRKLTMLDMQIMDNVGISSEEVAYQQDLFGRIIGDLTALSMFIRTNVVDDD